MVLKLDLTGSCRSHLGCFFFLFFFLLFIAPFGFASSISIMTYNVENLFDATDDGIWQGDPTFLPMRIKRKWAVNKCMNKKGFRQYLCENLDWTQAKYEERLRRVARVIQGYDRGRGADIVVLEEIENRRVIVDLWFKHLRWKGYRFPIHFESPSRRGIDVGVFSRFRLASPARYHRVDLSGIDPSPTRYVVEATFEIRSGQLLRIAANHWPSLSHVVETRLEAAEVVKKIARRSQRQSIPFIALGDFNTLPSESPNPIHNNLADHSLRGRSRPLVDLQDYLGGYAGFRQPGSHFYRGEWSPLDRILVSKNLLASRAPLKVDLVTFGIYAPRYIFTENAADGARIPYRYNFLTDEGYSDHLPVVLKLKLR